MMAQMTQQYFNEDIDLFTEILEREMTPALGCTDPAGIAFAAAYARQHIKGRLLEVRSEISVNVIKNAAAVCIPRTGGRHGVRLALALGAIAGNAENGLEVFRDLMPEDTEQAQSMIDREAVSFSVAAAPETLYIKVTVTTTEGSASAVIRGSYTNVAGLIVNGKSIPLKTEAESAEKPKLPYDRLSLAAILSYAETVPIDRLGIIEKAISMNMAIAEEGFVKNYGMCAGRNIKKYVENGRMGRGLASTAMMCVASATDARMAGCDMPVISNTGSGNQGLASTVPVVSIARMLDAPHEAMVRAVAVSSLVTIYIKRKLGALSAVCGAVIAGAGTGCGAVYLLGGDREQMLAALNSTLGDVAGMICDGAKAGCSMKVATCTNTGIVSALMAMDQKGIEGSDGIVDSDETITIDNFIKIATEGMGNMDHVILDIILKKEGAAS